MSRSSRIPYILASCHPARSCEPFGFVAIMRLLPGCRPGPLTSPMNARQSLISGGSLQDRSRPTAFSQSRIIRLEVTLAAALVVGALVWSWLRGLGLVGHLSASGSDLLIGLLAASALC